MSVKLYMINNNLTLRPVVAQGHKIRCKCDRLWVRLFPLEDISFTIFIFSKRSEALSSATQHATPPEFGEKIRNRVS